MTRFTDPFLCPWCKHLDRSGDDPLVFRCLAFPVQIPPAILANEVDHRQPYSTDGGVVFELDPGAEDEPPVKNMFDK